MFTLSPFSVPGSSLICLHGKKNYFLCVRWNFLARWNSVSWPWICSNDFGRGCNNDFRPLHEICEWNKIDWKWTCALFWHRKKKNGGRGEVVWGEVVRFQWLSVRLQPETVNFLKNHNNFINWFKVMNDICICLVLYKVIPKLI